MSESDDVPRLIDNVPLLERVSNLVGVVSKSERKVAELVLADPSAFIALTMAGVADAADVSEPTVMRFCNSLGFDGFQSFKMHLAQALALGMPLLFSAIDENDSVAQITKKVFDHSITSLDKARSNIDVSSLEAAVVLLAAAPSVLFVGFGASGIIAQDAVQKFPEFGRALLAPADPHQMFMTVATMPKESVVVVISNTGRTATALEIAREARRRGLSVIGITGDETPLFELSDVGIVVRTFEDTDLYTPSVSRLAGLAVVDILATSVAVRLGTSHIQRIREMKQGLTSFRT